MRGASEAGRALSCFFFKTRTISGSSVDKKLITARGSLMGCEWPVNNPQDDPQTRFLVENPHPHADPIHKFFTSKMVNSTAIRGISALINISTPLINTHLLILS
jgi:hypothetical protein